AAEGGDRVAGVGLGVRLGDRGAHGDAARVGVFDDGHGGRPALVVGGAPGGVGVHVVVVAHRLAVQLLGGGQPGGTTGVGVQGGLLVGVLAVAQGGGALPGGAGPGRQRGTIGGSGGSIDSISSIATGSLELGALPGGHVHVVGGGVPEGVSGEPAALVEGEPTPGDCLGDLAVTGRVHHDGHAVVVLRRRADHGRAADVDLFDALLLPGAGGHGVGEGVQVGHHEVDRGDLEFLELAPVGFQTAVGEDAGVDARVQGLDPAVEAFGEFGDFFHRGDRHAGLGDHRGGGSGGDDLHAGGVQGLGEFGQAGLVEDGDQGAADGDAITHTVLQWWRK